MAVRRYGGDRGASALEYAGLIVLAAVILGGLYAIGIPEKVSSGVGTALCRILNEDNCGGRQPSANGSPTSGPGQSSGPAAAPRPTDPLQVRAEAAGYPQPNPQAQQPPPQPGQANAVTNTPWGKSYGHGPGNPGIGGPGDLPTGGDIPYVPPKKGHGKPVKVKGKPAYVDDQDRTWEWDRLHQDHWDVTDKNGDHINVNPDGSEARKPKGAQPSPSASPQPTGGGKSHFDWKPWGIAGGVAAGGGLLWWGGKVLSPACGPLVLACAVVL